jgi:hypothetical protein
MRTDLAWMGIFAAYTLAAVPLLVWALVQAAG